MYVICPLVDKPVKKDVPLYFFSGQPKTSNLEGFFGGEYFFASSNFWSLRNSLSCVWIYCWLQGRIKDFKGALLKILGYFVLKIKNHDFTPKNHIFSNFWGVRPPPPPDYNCLIFFFRNLFPVTSILRSPPPFSFNWAIVFLVKQAC